MRREVRKRAGMCLVCGDETDKHSLYCRSHTRTVLQAKPSYASQQSLILQTKQTSARKKN